VDLELGMTTFKYGTVSMTEPAASRVRIKIGPNREWEVSTNELNDLIQCGLQLQHGKEMDQNVTRHGQADMTGV
jgi:hypothetical protein